MSATRKDVLQDCLSVRQDMKLINMKFFRGASDVITDEEFRTEVCAAAERKRTGEVRPGSAPKCRKPSVSVHSLVAKA